MELQTNITAQRILEAAEAEFIARGYEGARTTSIAQAAGVTHAMLHYYFRTKKNLFERIITDKFSIVGKILVTNLINPHIPLFEKISVAIEQHLEFIANNPGMPAFIINEVFTRNEYLDLIINRMKEVTRPMIAALQTEIDQYAARGLCRPVSAATLLLDIVSLNIFSFIAQPVVNSLLGDLMIDKDAFLAARKKENVETILRKLKV